MFTKVLALAALAVGQAAADTLTVNVASTLRPVTHVASGSLYGLADGSIPSNDLVLPIKPNTFVQMAPGGRQQGGGDALVVAAKAKQVGAEVIVRMCDWYPGWPYKWVSWDDWLSVIDKMVDAVKASGATNIAAYEIWNEPDGTWLSAAGSFNEGWVRSYNRIKTKDTSKPISGPSLSYYNGNTMQSFLSYAKQNNALPDIVSWHELGGPNYIADHVSAYRALEKSLGISPRPISIEEYATRTEVGVPGVLVSYIAKFERAGVHDAELPFWNQYGALGDLLTGKGGQPNGAWYLYRWYGSMSGQMVQTTPPNQSGLDGAASYDASTHTVSIIVGNGNGNTAVVVNGLTSAQGFSSGQATVTLEYTPSNGRTTPVSGTVTVSTTTYTINGGSISVPISSMNSAYGYHITIVPAGQPTPTQTTSQPVPTTTTAKPIPTPTPTNGGSSLWGQCGGINWSGATTCSQGKCVKVNDYYYQCQ